MSRLFSVFFILSLFVPSFSYDRKAAEEELRYLSKDARAYLNENLIWVVVSSVVIFAMVLCICYVAIRMIFDLCRTGKSKEKVVDVEGGSSLAMSTADSG
ncbi:hypothetical protein PENTCL1PPCAC_5753, partial [Pristionchus entomophagus]